MLTTFRCARPVSIAAAALLIISACAGPAEEPGPATPGETPPGVATPAEPPGEATPAETPAETVAGTPGETPAGTPGETPGGTPGETPAGTPGETPAGTPTAVASPPSGATGDLFAFGVTYEDADEIGKERVDFFRELNPDVNITFSESGFDEAAFLTALQTDQPPDVIRIDTGILGTYVARGVLEPVDSCLESWGVDPSTFYDAPINQATINGELYGVPEFMTTMNWLVNESAFTDAELDPANFDFSDWEALASANEAMLQANGEITAIGIDPKIPEFFPLWAKANGVDLISEDGTTAQFDQPGAVEALQFTVDLIEAHGGSVAFYDYRSTWDPNFFGPENHFATDQVGTHPMEQWYLNVLAGESPDVDVIARPFVDREGNGLTMATGGSFAIPTASRNPDAACAFAVAMTHPDAWLRAAQERKRLRDESGEANTGVFTANRVANDRIFSEVVIPSELPAPWGEAVQVYLDNWDNAFAVANSPANAAIFFGSESIMAQAVARAQEGEDVQQVLTDANQQAQDAIDRAAGN